MPISTGMFKRKNPCNDCPFRNSGEGLRGLHHERCDEIHATMLSDWGVFWCHKSTREVDDDSDDGSHADISRATHCVGAMVYALHHDRATIPMRIGASAGEVQLKQLFEKWKGQIVRTLRAWKKRQDSLYEARPSSARRPTAEHRRVSRAPMRKTRARPTSRR